MVLRSVPRHDLKTRPDGRIAVSTQSRSANTGLVDVGLGRRGWLYSKKLFSDRSIEQTINEQLFPERDATDAPVGQGYDAAH